jgi:CheY-like chemotaxis protein
MPDSSRGRNQTMTEKPRPPAARSDLRRLAEERAGAHGVQPLKTPSPEEAGRLLHDIVLVAITGYEREADRQRSLQTGCDHHLVKPADFGKVREILAAAARKAT